MNTYDRLIDRWRTEINKALAEYEAAWGMTPALTTDDVLDAHEALETIDRLSL